MPVAEQHDMAFLGRGWAFPVDPAPAGDVTMAAYAEDVRQSILIILGTEPGERVMRLDFGAGLRALVFEPLTAATQAMLRQRVEAALITWEPRIDVQDIQITVDNQNPGRLLIDISYMIRTTNTFYNLVYPFYLQER